MAREPYCMITRVKPMRLNGTPSMGLLLAPCALQTKNALTGSCTLLELGFCIFCLNTSQNSKSHMISLILRVGSTASSVRSYLATCYRGRRLPNLKPLSGLLSGSKSHERRTIWILTMIGKLGMTTKQRGN